MSDDADAAGVALVDWTKLTHEELGQIYRDHDAKVFRDAAMRELERRRREREALAAYADEVNGPPSHRMRLVTRRARQQDERRKKPPTKPRTWHDGRAAAAGDD